MLQSARSFATQLPAIRSVAVIGGGQMGSGIAQVVAQSGQAVHLVDTNEAALKNARRNIESRLQKLAKKKKDVSEVEYLETVLKKISYSLDMGEATRNADLVIEAVSEDMKLKRNIFSELDKIAPENTVFGTNTSSLSVRDIACATKRPDKFAGIHFFNPVPALKLVELVRTPEVSAEIYEHLKEWIRSLDRVPIACKDTPGFIVNRLLFPLITEAIRMYERGDAELRDIDEAMKLGCAHPMGPIELSDFIGQDIILSSSAVWRDLHPGNSLFAPLKSQLKLAEEGKLGIKSGEGYYKYTK